jgi:hypothetical protein
MKKLILLSFLALIGTRALPQSCISINAGPDKCASPCATLTATLTGASSTTSYKVNTIPYSLQSLDGTLINNHIDDIWSPVINLGFPFCYYGTTYNQICVGANGMVTFDLSKANTTNQWKIWDKLSGNNYANIPDNTICALWRDIDPSIAGATYIKTVGTSPCRSIVISWANTPLYHASTCTPAPAVQTFQLVLYENSNFIDVNIQRSTSCTNWNDGLGIIGLYKNSTTNLPAPGRDYPAAWSITNESWRFSPDGAIPTITWTGPNGVIGTGASINVCPTTTATYTASTSVTNCSGTFNISDQVFVSTKPSSDFSMVANHPAGSPYYTITATTVATPAQYPNLSFDWSVEEVNSSDAPIPNTRVDNPVCWWSYPVTNTFPGYDYTVSYTSANNTGTLFNYNGSSCAVTTPGKFRAGGRYRIQHGTYTPQCGFDQLSHIVYMSARPGGDAVLSIDEKSENATLDVYPNPSNGSFTINAGNNDLKEVYVYDAMGKVVYSKKNTIEQTFQIDVTELPKGLYLVKVISNSGIQVQKVISE